MSLVSDKRAALIDDKRLFCVTMRGLCYDKWGKETYPDKAQGIYLCYCGVLLKVRLTATLDVRNIWLEYRLVCICFWVRCRPEFNIYSYGLNHAKPLLG